VEKERKNKLLEVAEGKNYTTILSGYDLCRFPMLGEWIETGVSAFKLEGRMKNSYYIANVVRVYREALDKIKKNRFCKEYMDFGLSELDKISHREYSLNLQSNPFMDSQELKNIYVGDVIEVIGEDEAYVKAKGRITVGEEYEILTPVPYIKNERIRVRKIFRNGREITKGGGGEIYRVIFDGNIYSKSILRRVL
jgi:putative protease